jgi:hypothetical protein
MTNAMESPATPASVLAQLPNGLHNAFIRELRVDFASAAARLVIDFSVGDPNAPTGPAREERRRGTLTLTGLSSLTVEPPDARYELMRDCEGIWVDGDFGAYPGDPPRGEDGLVRLWFFVQTWNARMLFTADACGLEWA